MSAQQENRGCARCELLRTEQDNEVGLDRVLADVPFDRPRVEGATVAYDRSWLSRCPDCGTHWLTQFWEIFDDILQENGSRRCISYPIGAADVLEIESAVKRGIRMPHDRFR